MHTDVLSLNKTTKSILKNPDPKSSLAFTNSIMRKDPSKITTEGIGLNPNVPLEDEYIQNLQKQIHFMDLEIKLMKEKQTQEEALGGNYQFAKIGLNDGKPATDHIMTATSKLMKMKQDLTKQINLLEQELMRQREENTIAQAKVTNMDRHVKEDDERLNKVMHDNAESMNNIRTKYLGEKKHKEEIEMDIHKIKAHLEKVTDENEKLKKDVEVKAIHEDLEDKRFTAEEKLDLENIEIKKKLITNLTAEKSQVLLVTEKDPRLQVLREDHEKLEKALKDSEKKLDNVNYRVLETETLQALSLKKKDEDQETRKKLQTELEKWKDQLDETIRANELKVERKLREAESPKIRELQAILIKERHELNELKQKFEAILNKETEYVLDRANRNRYKAALEHKKMTNTETLKALHTEIVDLEPKVNDLQAHVESLKFKIGDGKEERVKLDTKLKIVEEENITLLSKFQFLQNNIKLDEDMKKFNIEDLRNVLQTNHSVNETIRDFMDKWDTLKKFSKMP